MLGADEQTISQQELSSSKTKMNLHTIHNSGSSSSSSSNNNDDDDSDNDNSANSKISLDIQIFKILAHLSSSSMNNTALESSKERLKLRS